VLNVESQEARRRHRESEEAIVVVRLRSAVMKRAMNHERGYRVDVVHVMQTVQCVHSPYYYYYYYYYYY
jgi:rRNA pseudouridine-1189 N-methylase Emg1 (Nep1/Mra1 family)